MEGKKDFARAFFEAFFGEDVFNLPKRNHDPKTIGDVVKLVDIHHLNYFIDVETDKQLAIGKNTISDAVIDLFESHQMIVIENNINKVYKCGHCSIDHSHDMIIFIPGMNKRYYVSSDSFEILNK